MVTSYGGHTEKLLTITFVLIIGNLTNLMETHACCTEGCSNEGSLRCPTCKDMGISGQFFCSQSCFKGSWETHKLVHKAFKAEAAAAAAQHTAVTASVRLPKSFDGYIFSGKLRPGVVGPRAIVPKHILKPDYAETGVPTSEMRLKGSSTIPVLSDDDRIKMRRACRCDAYCYRTGAAS